MIYCEKVSELFGLSGDEIAQRMENFYNDNSDAEKKSWRASLPKLIEVIQSAGLGNLYIATEYELPAGGRIDAALIGDDDNVLSFKLDAPSPCRLDAPDLDLICYASADCLHQHLQVI